MHNIISQLEANGFKIRGKHILKKSSRGGLKVAGILNENNFYFFSDNVYPYKGGINFLNESTLVNHDELTKYKTYVRKETEKGNNTFLVDFKTYYEATSSVSVFTDFLRSKTIENLNTTPGNYFDLRGVSRGLMKGAVLFPFIDYDGNFQTAQIIKYDSNGKRIKSKYSTNWLHSYKDIKEDLGLDKLTIYSKKITCFFGENYLNSSSNPVAIVEAPKTAVILKEIYPNIDWIATAGEQALFSKNHEILRDRNVILFPDAFTTKWREFGERKGYNVSSILEDYNCEEGSDLADYVFNSDNEVFNPLHNLLYSINTGDYDFKYKEDKLELCFLKVADDTSYFTAVPHNDKEEKFILYKDNSEEFHMIFDHGKNFLFYNEKYSVLNAQIDWHKRDVKKGGKLIGFNETSFIWHLQKCYLTLKYLNPDRDVSKIFTTTLKKLNTESNFRFNEKYVLRRLVPIWDSIKIPIEKFFKYRDWKYKGGNQLSRSEFETELNNDRFRYKTLQRLLAFQDVLKEDRFIFLETDLAIGKGEIKGGFRYLAEIAREWNRDVIGCTTENQFFKNLEFYDKIGNCTKLDTPHIKNTYRVYSILDNEAKSILSKEYSVLELSEITEVSRPQIKRILDHRPNRDTQTLIINRVDELIERIKEIEPFRMEYTDKNGAVKKRITNFNIRERVSFNDCVSYWEEVFKSAEVLVKELNEMDTAPDTKLEKFLAKRKRDGNGKLVYSYRDISLLEINYLNYLASKSSESKVLYLPKIIKQEQIHFNQDSIFMNYGT